MWPQAGLPGNQLAGQGAFHHLHNLGMRVAHWQERGHRAAAEIMARELRARPH